MNVDRNFLFVFNFFVIKNCINVIGNFYFLNFFIINNCMNVDGNF